MVFIDVNDENTFGAIDVMELKPHALWSRYVM